MFHSLSLSHACSLFFWFFYICPIVIWQGGFGVIQRILLNIYAMYRLHYCPALMASLVIGRLFVNLFVQHFHAIPNKIWLYKVIVQQIVENPVSKTCLLRTSNRMLLKAFRCSHCTHCMWNNRLIDLLKWNLSIKQQTSNFSTFEHIKWLSNRYISTWINVLLIFLQTHFIDAIILF